MFLANKSDSVLFCVPGLTDDTQVRFVHHQQFKGETKWPMKTTIACWHCTEGFATIPIPIPVRYDPDTNIYEVFGVFCSFSCAKGYLHEHPHFNTTMCLSLFSEMALNVFGVRHPIYIAPPRTSLDKFGGPYSLKEFRENSCTLDTLWKTPPLVFSEMFYQETKYEDPNNEEKKTNDTPDEAPTTSEPSAFNEYVQKIIPRETGGAAKTRAGNKKQKISKTNQRGTLLHLFT